MKYDDAIIKNPKSKYHSLYWSNITNTFVTRHQIVILNQLINGAWQPAKPSEIPD